MKPHSRRYAPKSSGPRKGSASPALILHNVGQKLRRLRHELAQMMAQVDAALARIEAEAKA